MKRRPIAPLPRSVEKMDTSVDWEMKFQEFLDTLISESRTIEVEIVLENGESSIKLRLGALPQIRTPDSHEVFPIAASNRTLVLEGDTNLLANGVENLDEQNQGMKYFKSLDEIGWSKEVAQYICMRVLSQTPERDFFHQWLEDIELANRNGEKTINVLSTFIAPEIDIRAGQYGENGEYRFCARGKGLKVTGTSYVDSDKIEWQLFRDIKEFHDNPEGAYAHLNEIVIRRAYQKVEDELAQLEKKFNM